MWNDENIKILDILDKLSNKECEFPIECPICKKVSGHVYMSGQADCIGSAWVWCSDCHSFAHFQYRIPAWWVNCSSIDFKELKFEPDYLESNKIKIDQWINSLFSKER